MEIWDSLNRRYLDFIKKRGARREESWLFRGLREPGRGRAEELARRALGPGSGFLPKKGKAGKKCEAAAGGGGERRPRDGGQHGRLAAPGIGAAAAAAGVAGAGAWSREPRRARYAAVRPPVPGPRPRAAGSKLLQPRARGARPGSPAAAPARGDSPGAGGARGRRGGGAPGGVGWGRALRPGAPTRAPSPAAARPARRRGVGSSLLASLQAARESWPPRRFPL